MKKDKRKIEEKNSNNMVQNEAVEFQATAKKVQKISRDGLIEQNKQTGEKTRISKKEQDTSFQKKDRSIPLQRKHDAAVPHSARSKRTRIRNALKSNRKKSRDQYSNTSQVSGIDVSKNSLETEEIPVNTQKARKKYPAGKSKLDYKNHSPTIEQTQKKQQKKVMWSLVLKNKAIKTANRINPPASTPEQRLEKEIKPQGKQNVLSTASKKVTGTATKEVISAIHSKVRTTEKDNVGIEAAHKAEQRAENSITSMVYHSFRKIQKRPYEQLSRLEKQMQRVSAKYEYQKALQENPVLKNKLFAKFQQKRKIKQKYAKSLRQAQKASSTMKEAFSSGGKAVKAASQFIMRHSFLFAALGVITVLFFLISTGLTSCSSMTTSSLSAIVNTSYLASDKDINEAEKFYCSLEEELQVKIDNVKEDYPGFDRYRVDNIGHNPFELISYLTAEFNDFQAKNVERALSDVFKAQYNLYFVQSTEIKTDSKGNSYVISILTTHLDVTPLSNVFQNKLDTEEKKERYQAYLQTKGNRQYFNSPFVFDWIPYVTEIYGDNTVKMTVPADTEILAGKDGTVTSAGYTTIIEDKKGYKTIYSGLSSCNVKYGEKVKAGDVIGTAERNIELLYFYGKQTLNPYFFVATLGSGIPGLPDKPFIPPDPGTPMGDGSYDSLIKEAEKYLGYPYVWGGSKPSTSFDCSGFVCWVFTHSGVYDLPRTTAQGIFNQSTPVSPEDAKLGDIITFTNTYSTPNPVSHIGIYVGNGMMIHCGDPISYANINSPYWRSHFYSFGRLN